jgi:hypothetical protein
MDALLAQLHPTLKQQQWQSSCDLIHEMTMDVMAMAETNMLALAKPLSELIGQCTYLLQLSKVPTALKVEAARDLLQLLRVVALNCRPHGWVLPTDDTAGVPFDKPISFFRQASSL